MAPDAAPWYASGFDEHYPLMQTFEEAWTEVQAASVEVLLDLPPGARILDLCCGYGRHSRAWGRNGHWTAGLDLSAPLLRRARDEEPGGRWARGDMRRLPFAAGAFDAAAILFSSFGYFDTRAEDLASLQEIHRILRPGGGVYLELRNPDHLRHHVPPDDAVTIQGVWVAESSRIAPSSEGDRYEIRRHIRAPGQPERRYFYSMRLYRPGEIRDALLAAGFADIALYGDFQGSPASPALSRLIATAQKAGDP
ncbi:MAG: class I SAM-dependent methyltransferase [Candidatus Tectomicrobia bacterium]|uniref:Class I SAM-dependent methyltransferase n=1 Tax=Tectimicrobiota bacterium TaxID=2528274 RepID=A0A932HYW9_UNCTE|nr:class I SAM-dependent methyltransferase [Candidatus Tectomicrobia bacterium]